jgi:uncharacterized protein (TIGR01777 family)
MKVLITGITGLIGTRISKLLIEQGHEVIGLTRDIDRAKSKTGLPIEFYQWNPTAEAAPKEAVEKADAIINLVGENIANKRWSKKQKQVMYDTRVVAAKNLIQTIDSLDKPIEVYVGGSAIGYYVANNGGEKITESSPASSGYLADLCKDWEEAHNSVKNVNRKVIVRTGVVLDPNEGALSKLLPLFKLGGGGPVGSGSMFMSWVHIQDIARIFIEAIRNNNITGPVNGTAPTPITNKAFSKFLGKAVNRPAFMPAPPFALKLAMGEMSQIVLDSQYVVPEKLEANGFKFEFEDIEKALLDLVNNGQYGHIKKKVNCMKFEAYQWVPEKREKVFEFFSEAKNLEKITPDFLNFKVTYQSTDSIQSGTVFQYKLSLHGLPLKWETHIENWNPDKSFSDYQTKGPYKIWHHTHKFQDYKNGTLMTDTVYYKLPFGFLGELFGGWYVKKDVKNIFKHRTKVIEEVYGK